MDKKTIHFPHRCLMHGAWNEMRNDLLGAFCKICRY